MCNTLILRYGRTAAGMFIYVAMQIFVCLFQSAKDAERFYKALIQRLARLGLEVAEEKTQIIVFSHVKAKAKIKFDFLG